MSSIQGSVIPSYRSLALTPMRENLAGVIAALEVEPTMIESHARRLLEMVPSMAGDEQRHEMLQLAKDETDRAEAIKRQIRLLQDHL